MRRQRGNILFLILLAVVLFAALSYAVTQSLRGGGNDASNEKNSVQTSDLLNYFAQLDTAVQRMMLSDNVKDYELNFFYQTASNFVMGGQDNSNCTASRCRVFDPAGGAVSGRKLNTFTRGTFPGGTPTVIYYVKVPGVGSDADDIVLALHQPNSRICKDINNRFGLNDMIYTSNISGEGASTSPYNYGVPVGPIGVSGHQITNVPANAYTTGTWCSCINSTAAACEADNYRPVIYHVLVAR